MAGQLFPTVGRPIELTKPEMVIGRAAGCDIVINEKFISSRHCLLLFAGDMWMVKDLGSTNGTETNKSIAKDLTPMPSGYTLILAKRLRFAIEYDAKVEFARFRGDEDDSDVIDRIAETRGYSEHGPATARLTGRHPMPQDPRKRPT